MIKLRTLSVMLCVCLTCTGLVHPSSVWALTTNQSTGKNSVIQDVVKITSIHSNALKILQRRIESDTVAKKELEVVYDPSVQVDLDSDVSDAVPMEKIENGSQRNTVEQLGKRSVLRQMGREFFLFIEVAILVLTRPFSESARHHLKWYYLYRNPVKAVYSPWVFERKYYSYALCARIVLERYMKMYASDVMLLSFMKNTVNRVNDDVVTIFCDVAKNGGFSNLESLLTHEVVLEAIRIRSPQIIRLVEVCARANAKYAKEIFTDELLVYAVKERYPYVLELCRELVKDNLLNSDEVFVPAVFEALLKYPEYILKATRLYLDYPFTVNGGVPWQRAFHRGIKNMFKSHGGRPRLIEQYEPFARLLSGPVSHYLKQCVTIGDSERMAEQFHAISSFMVYVHYDIDIVLNACERLLLPISSFLPLKEAIKSKAALVHIFSLFGGGPSGRMPGNSFLHKFKSIVAVGDIDSLLRIMVDISKRHGVKSPQEIDGLLSILPKDLMIVSFWTKDDWLNFERSVTAYYEEGFSSLAPGLFAFYCAHKNNREAIVKFQDDIDVAMREPIKRGTFTGFSEDFMAQYSLTEADELALLSEYVPVAFNTTNYYASTYVDVKKHVMEMQKKESLVDAEFRKALFFNGAKESLVANSEVSIVERYYVFEHLQRYINKPDATLEVVLQKYVSNPYSVNEHDFRHAIIYEVLQRFKGSYASLMKTPSEVNDQYHLLKSWQRFFDSPLFSEIRDHANECIKECIAEMSRTTVEENFSKMTHRFTEKMTIDMKRNIVMTNLFALTVPFMKELIKGDQDLIARVLHSYEKKRIETKDVYSVGFFDGAAYSMTPMFHQVRVFSELRRQLKDDRYHYGSIVVRDDSSGLIGAAHVQFAQAFIAGQKKQKSKDGWSVLSLSTFTVPQYRNDCDEEAALKAMFAYAQIMSNKAGLQGAVIPIRRRFHGRRGIEGRIVQEFVNKGWLVPCTLSEPIVYTTNKFFCPGPLIYTEAYKIAFPKEEIDKYKTQILDGDVSFDGMVSFCSAA